MSQLPCKVWFGYPVLIPTRQSSASKLQLLVCWPQRLCSSVVKHTEYGSVIPQAAPEVLAMVICVRI